jgi:hypothetical protein
LRTTSISLCVPARAFYPALARAGDTGLKPAVWLRVVWQFCRPLAAGRQTA